MNGKGSRISVRFFPESSFFFEDSIALPLKPGVSYDKQRLLAKSRSRYCGKFMSFFVYSFSVIKSSSSGVVGEESS